MLEELVRYYFLNAPLRLGGWEGADFADICASLTSIPSSHWMGNDIRRLDCEARITRAVASWTAAVICGLVVMFVTLMVWNFPTLLLQAGVFFVSLFSNTKQILKDKKEKANAQRKETIATNKRNEKSHTLLLQLVSFGLKNPSVTLKEALTTFQIEDLSNTNALTN